MNADQKLVNAAKRAAKTHAREHSIPYQNALDVVAAKAGRSTWKAFLDDPVPIDDAAASAAAEPDFSTLEWGLQLDAALAYARSTGAAALSAGPREWSDPRPTLKYLTPDSGWRGVDARGLDLRAVARSLIGTSTRPLPGRIGYATRFDDAGLVRAAISYGHDGDAEPSVTISLDGAAAPEPVVHAPPSTGCDTARSEGARARIGRGAIRRMTERGLLSRDAGLLVGYEDAPLRRGLRIAKHGAAIRLSAGYGMLAVSPPGAGRLAQVSLPILLDDETSSFVVHDDFGQVLEYTSGWRASIGRVAVVRTDGACPDAINPLDAAWLPQHPRALNDHVLTMMMIVADDDMTVADLLARTALGMIQRDGGTTMRAVHREVANGTDPLSRLAADALVPFTTDLMHAAFGRNTVVPADLRGRVTQGGRPFTLYLKRGRIPHRRDAMMVMVQEAIWLRMLSHGPNEQLPNGEASGPRQVVSMLNDLHRMPRMRSLVRTLDLQRAKRHSTVITTASAGAIVQRYGAWEADMIRQCCSLRFACTQSDPEDAAFIDPDGRFGGLSYLGEREGVLLSMFGEARIRTRGFFETQRLLQRCYNPRMGKGPKPVAMGEPL